MPTYQSITYKLKRKQKVNSNIISTKRNNDISKTLINIMV